MMGWHVKMGVCGSFSKASSITILLTDYHHVFFFSCLSHILIITAINFIADVWSSIHCAKQRGMSHPGKLTF